MSSALSTVAGANTSNTLQFGRVCTLLVSNKQGNAMDLSNLRIKFMVKKSGIMTPNSAVIRVYNLDLTAAATIRKEFTKVILQAGYVGNFGGVFRGNIKQVILGRENATDTFIDIVGGDGDQAYNFAIVNKTLAAGSSNQDQLNASFTAMFTQGVGQGYVGTLPPAKLPRGKVMYGAAKDYVRNVADSTNCSWSIQDEQVVFLSEKTYLPGQAVVLTSKTGMVGTPSQTTEGINIKCLLNPKLKCHGRVQINNASVAAYQLNPSVPGSPANTPALLTADGVYYILVAEYIGDTRGTDWYTNLVCLSIDPSSNPLNSVQVGSGANG